jgi:DNA invertase Pin-like site-specific DNA recombinase
MAALLAVFAAVEREIRGERVRAGLAHARQNGKRLGRPATAAQHANQIRKLCRSSGRINASNSPLPKIPLGRSFALSHGLARRRSTRR